MTVHVVLADGSSRYFHGHVSRFFAGDEDVEKRRNYRAEVVPWLWFLTRTSDCRIFQQKTAPEIIEQIFKDLGFSDFKAQLSGKHPEREYCVQYRETDFNFVSRLMEEEGIFYFFQHEKSKHTLVLADQKSAYVDCPEKQVDYPRDPGSRAIEDHLTAWEHRYEFRTGKWAQTDYNFEDHPARSAPLPAKLMMTNESTTVDLPDAKKYEFYDFPGTYAKKDEGDGYTKLRMEEEEVGYDVVHASSNCRTFFPAGSSRSGITSRSSEKGKGYVITSLQHSATEGYERADASDFKYRNNFTCIPDSVVFRPARTTPRPMIHGVQPAVVTGPPGEEIYPDKYGRVKVQFFWDREGKTRRQEFLLGPRLAGLRRQGLGHGHHPADRPGGARLFPGRRPRPADHHRPRLQRRPDAPLSAAVEEDGQRHQVEQHARRRRIQRIHPGRHQG